jgi:hypothetical protein
LDETTHNPADSTSQLENALEPLLKRLAELLARQLAPRLAANAPAEPRRRLLTLDELVAQLPSGKKPETWKAWLYQRTRLGQVPGCVKIGGRLFFDPEHTLPWLLSPSQTGCTDGKVDLPRRQSLHATTMDRES